MDDDGKCDMTNAAISTYVVTGMTCGHCETGIREEVGAVPGVIGVEVSATDGRLAVRIADGTTVSDQAILDAIDEAGYTGVRT